MLTEKALKKYLIFTHQVTSEGRDYILSCRTDESARMVGIHARTNVCSWYVSAKMGQTVASESRGPERCFVLLSDYDDRIFEIWCQPPPVKVQRTNKNGIKVWGTYISDFLVLTTEGPRIIEVKTKDEVEKLITDKPDDWMRVSEDKVEYIPAKEAFEKIGLVHEVFVYTDDLRYLVANLEMIMQSRKMGVVANSDKNDIIGAFDQQFGWTLYELKEALNLQSYTPIIQMIDVKGLYIDIRNDLLSLPESCIVARTPLLVNEAKSLYRADRVYDRKTNEPCSISTIPNQAYAEEILIKLDKIATGDMVSSVRRWKRLIREGEEKGMTPFQSLIPKKHLRGDRRSKINNQVEEFLIHYLYNVHPKFQGISLYRSYINYRCLADEEHPVFDPVSRKTFKLRLDRIPPAEIAYITGGKRPANAAADPSAPEKRALKPQLAWQTAAIDHYLTDIYLVCIVGEEVYVMRPWLTAMIDLSSSVVLAVSISFCSPSRKSNAKVIRDCVRRHGRLPSEIIVDRGPDFTSVYFAALLAHYGVTYSLRPSGHSRFGGEIEGFFGEFKKIWLCQRPGNLADYKNVRAIDGKFKPDKTAVLKPHDFYRELNAFCQWRESQCRGARLTSPSIQKNQNEEDFPFVSIPVEYNDELLLATAVDTNTYKIDFQRGLHIGQFWYWHPDISKVRGRKKKLEVRVDPENPYLVYALIDNNWVTCTNTRINSYSAKNHDGQFVEGLLQIETSEIRNAEKLAADEMIVRMLREMDAVADSGEGVPVINMDKPEDDRAETIFSCIKQASVDKVNLKYWEEIK